MSLAEVLEQAMKLSTQERAALAHELLDSLDEGDGCSEEEGEEAAAAEIRARLARMDRGESVPCDCREAMAEIRARLERYERGETMARPWRAVMDELEKELDEESR